MNNTFMNQLDSHITNASNMVKTENGANAFSTTNSAVLDFFGNGGALRERDDASIIQVFEKAYAEDPELAVKAMFYFRDVRGGQGERKTFRILLKHFATTNPALCFKIVHLVSTYGRWDDLFSLMDTELENEVFSIFRTQLASDKNNERPSLLAKWMKSENASSKETRRIAKKTRKALQMNSRDYRKMLTALRKQIGLVETAMSTNEWEGINYSNVPSKAGMIYRKAFGRHDGERYAEFLVAVENGEETINAGTLYPYEIVEKILYEGAVNDKTLDVMWANLPDYMDGNEVNGLVVADVSGSMCGRPMAVSISLAMYIAERNTGPFHNKFMTFSDEPKIQTIVGDSFSQQVQNLKRAAWGFNTNIKATFDVILETAKLNNMKQSDIPTHLYIVSDMEFDGATQGSVSLSLFQTIKLEYAEAGYDMPFLVFWNVNSRNDQTPMNMDDRGFQTVSGCSPSILTSLLSNKFTTAYDLMLTVLNGERYAPITIK